MRWATLLISLLVASALPAQSTFTGKGSIQAKSTVPVPLVVITYAGVHCISNSGASMNCQLSAVPANAKVTIQLTDNVATTTVTSVFICAGTSTCGSSTDTISTDVAPTTVGGVAKFAAYSDPLASISGSVMVTIVVASSNAPLVFAQVWTKGCTASCFDQSGTASLTTTANYSVTTSGNVSAANEAAISVVNSGVVITAGTTGLCASSACTMLDISGGGAAEISSTAPTNGTAPTMTWTNLSGNAQLMVVTYK